MLDQTLFSIAVERGVRRRISRAIRRKYPLLGAALLSALLAQVANAQENPKTIYWAGVSFAGNASEIEQSNPYLFKFVNETGLNRLNTLAWEKLQSIERANIDLVTDLGRSTSGDAIAMTLALDFEVVNSVYYSRVNQVCAYVSVYAQLMTFDMTDRRLISAFPLSSRLPGDCELDTITLSERKGLEWIESAVVSHERSLLNALPAQLETLPLSRGWLANIKVEDIALGSTVITEIEKVGLTEGAYKRWLAAQVAARMSASVQIPVLPYTLGQAIGGAIPLRFKDSQAFNIALPPADFEIDLKARGYGKKELDQSNKRVANRYFFSLGIAFKDPMLGDTFFDETLMHRLDTQESKEDETPDWERYERQTIVLLADFFQQFPTPDKKWSQEHILSLEKKKTTWKSLKKSFAAVEQDVFEEMRGN